MTNMKKNKERFKITQDEFDRFKALWERTDFNIPFGDAFCNFYGIEDDILRIDRPKDLQITHIITRYIKELTPKDYADSIMLMLFNVTNEGIDYHRASKVNVAIKIINELIHFEAKTPDGSKDFFYRVIDELKKMV